MQTAIHTDKQDRYQQTNKQTNIKQKKADQNSHTGIMRHYGGG